MLGLSWKIPSSSSAIHPDIRIFSEAKIIEMNNKTLKYEIIEWITKTNDSSLLKALKSIKDSNASATADWYEELSDQEVDSINRGIENHEQGEVLTSKEFWSGYGE